MPVKAFSRRPPRTRPSVARDPPPTPPSSPPPPPPPPPSPITLDVMLSTLSPEALSRLSILRKLDVPPFRSVVWSDFPNLLPLFRASNLDKYLDSTTYTHFSPEVARVFWASLQLDEDRVFHGTIGPHRFSITNASIAQLFNVTPSGPTLDQLKRTYTRDTVCRALTIAHDTSPLELPIFPPRLLAPLPRAIARIVHYTCFRHRSGTGFNHIRLDLLYFVFAIVRGLQFDWAGHLVSIFHDGVVGFVPLSNLAHLFASAVPGGISSDLVLQLSSRDRFSKLTLTRMGIDSSDLAGSSSQPPPVADDGGEDADPELPSPEPTPVYSTASWSLRDAHLASDFDAASVSSGALVEGLSSLMSSVDSLALVVDSRFRHMEQRMDDMADPPRRRRRQ